MRSHVRRRLFAALLVAMLTTVVVLRRAALNPPRKVTAGVIEQEVEVQEEEVSNDMGYPEEVVEVEPPTSTAAPPRGFTVPDVYELRGPGHRLVVNGSGCKIPDLEAFSSVAREHSTPPEPLHCRRRKAHYRVTRALDEDYVSGSPVLSAAPAGLDCCFRHVRRRSQDDGNYRVSNNCEPLSLLLAPEEAGSSASDMRNAEFVRVQCSKPGGRSDEWLDEQYVDLHAFVPLKEEVEERCGQVPRQDDQLSVVILGVDSLSRLNVIRQLPETYQALTSAPLASVPLLGYNKVADNTFPNLMPVLAGRAVDEMARACDWPNQESASDSWSHKFDTCPLIWKEFAEKGFRTMYGEECPHLSTFNFQKAGFSEPPTDYYPRPLLQAATEELGHTHADNCHLCLGPHMSVEVLLNYASQFVRRFARERHFAFVWATSLTHDGLNMAGLADRPLARTVQGMVRRGDLERSVLIFLSDHGVRTGDFRLTPQGRMEERLPFVSLSFPAWFQQRFPAAMANLRANAGRLTTPFDLHETLRDLVAPAAAMQDRTIARRVREISQNKTKPRGISLFLEIPEDRDCESAGIPRHWCTCLRYRPLPPDDPGLRDAAAAMVSHINRQLLSPFTHRGCRELSLTRVLEARLGVAQNSEEEVLEEHAEAGIKDYALTIETSPGGGLFEGAVRSYRRRGRNNRNRVRFEVADTISRLNRYGNQSACVDDWVAKLYCYCGD